MVPNPLEGQLHSGQYQQLSAVSIPSTIFGRIAHAMLSTEMGDIGAGL
jgi:hypothetical protein